MRTDLPPSGNNGLMLGEILGRRAGLTCTELWLLRFFGSRNLSLESPRLMPAPALLGEAIPPSLGLDKAEVLAVIGALAGPYLGVFCADSVGVDRSIMAFPVLIGFRAGFLFLFAGSGKTMSSIICSMSASAKAACSFKLEVCRLVPLNLAACLRIFIKDAGVAGSSFVPFVEAACVALR